MYGTYLKHHGIGGQKWGKKVKFSNPQDRKRNLTKDLFQQYVYHRNNADAALTAIRLDNAEFNDSISNYITNTSSQFKSMGKVNVMIEMGSNFIMDQLKSY